MKDVIDLRKATIGVVSRRFLDCVLGRDGSVSSTVKISFLSPHLLRISLSPFSKACLLLAALFSAASPAIAAEKSQADKPPAPPSGSWPVFRGNAACDGVAAGG